MTVQLSIGPPVITINQGDTFMVTNRDGEIAADSEHGLFSRDTRFVSYYRLFLNGNRWHPLSSSATNYYSARWELVNQKVDVEQGTIERGSIALSISRQADNGINENLQLVNYSANTVSFNLEIALRSDFADIFEVREHRLIRRGTIETSWNSKERQLHTTYSNKDFQRQFIYRIIDCPSQVRYANGRIVYEIILKPAETWTAATRFDLLSSDRLDQHAGTDLSIVSKWHKQWKDGATQLQSSNEDFYRLYTQSVEDLGGLRLYSQIDLDEDEWLPAAGVPWYVTVFGRDSLLISMQAMMVHPTLSLAALKHLAALQADSRDDWRDAQPGKILHEVRHGELAHLEKIPHTPYYGSWDSTTLYLILLHEAWKWMGDDSLLTQHKETAIRCLEWIDNFGDLDQDGFQEYITYSQKGYENMGWKDSPDAIVYADGSQVKQPKALCELQGYLFDAWMRSAEVFAKLGDQKFADELVAKARRLQENFEEHFWNDEQQIYALALDKEKKQACPVASNIGHCLWTGLLRKDRAEKVVRRLMQEDMWSGWGIRTLSAKCPAYNPHSYHCGSVWPHDNGLISLGFKRYGFAAEAAQVARDISEAASFLVSYRLPELYAGIHRTDCNFPIQYDGANVPQGWAAGSVFHFLQAMTGIQADAPSGKLYVDPSLPNWLTSIRLSELRVGNARIALTFWRDGDETRWESEVQAGTIAVEQKPWAPW